MGRYCSSRACVVLWCIAILLCTACTESSRAPKIAPEPQVDLDGVDAAVVRAIRGAYAEVRRDPNSSKAWGTLGKVYLAHDFEAAAMEAFREAQRLESGEPRWPYFLGLHLSSYDAEAALPLLERAVQSAPEDMLSPLRQLADVYLELDRHEEARAIFQRILEADSLDQRSLLGLARVEFRAGEFQKSLTFLRRPDAGLARHRAARLLEAQVLTRLGNLDGASTARSEAARLPQTKWRDPLFQEVLALRRGLKPLLVRADVLLGRGKYAESQQLLENMVRDYPESTWAWILLGRAQIKLRQLDAAERALDRALELEPDSVEAMFRKGVIRVKREDITEAARLFRKAIELKPDFARAHYNLAICRHRERRLPAAVESVLASLASEPDSSEGHALLGQLRLELGELEAAAAEFAEALRLDPKNEWAQRLAAVVAERLAGR